MLRKNNPVLHHDDRSFWKYAEKMDDGHMVCKFCGHGFAKDTSISRIKFHLAGVKGRGVRICGQVPQDVQEAALAAIPIDGPPEKKLKTVVGSSNNEVTNAAQQQNNEMEPLERGSFHERPSFNQADEPRGDPSQPTNDQLYSSSVNNDVIVNDAQSNIELDNFSMDVGRTQVFQGMEQGGEEGRFCSHLNTGEGSVQHVDRIVPPMIDENYNRREATERLVQHGVGASSFGVYGNHNAISTSQQEQNNEVDNVAGDAGTVPGRSVEEYMRSLEDVIDNGTGGVAQPGAGASSSGGLRQNTSENRGAPLLTGSTKLVGRAFEENMDVIWSWLTDDEVSTIGIYGMGGSGKTTMLKHIYNELLQRPDISHHVYWVTVSQDFTIHKLQNKIAERIQLSFSNEEEEHRAAELSRELMKKQRWILILDDLWKSFDLHEVGIPAPLKGCKLLITTRSETICREMDSTNNVRVNPLSNEEAWTLLMEVLGHDRPLSPQVEQFARDITRECAGLPLGIKTIAGTMKGLDNMHEWRDALLDLKQSNVLQDKVEDKVFRILKFSYTHLNDEDLQQCFLYCGLYPEDFEIRREDLIDYLIDEGVVKRQKSREEEINKGHTMLDRLERACLLERLRGGNYVKMHDLIRDMAIQILKENSRAIVKAGAQLKELPNAEEWSEKLTSVSLMHNQIEEICSRHSPRCPNLSTLLLCENIQLGSDLFFKQLHGLKVLDLSETHIDCLPDSVSDLEGLTSLLLKHCRRLSSVPSLKKLRALKRLDLSRTPLKKIPHGLECLSNLRYLRMTGCGENKFPGGILPKLCDLQVFILEEWLFEIGKEIYAPVTVEGKEVGCLRKLESLECHFEDQYNYLEYLKSRDATQSLRTCKIVVGQLRGLVVHTLKYCDSGSKLVGLGNLNINRDADFLVIFSKDIQELLCQCIDARSIGDVLPLKYSLSSCNSMESLVLSCSVPLPQPSPSYNGIFSALKCLHCYDCKSMKKLFPSVLVPNLVNLEKISVSDCEKMEEIIGGTRSDEEGAMGEESIEFKLPKLRELSLSSLPELKSICSAKLICDSLQQITVYSCNSMEILVPSSWICIISLKEIRVEECEKMEEIIGGTRSDEEGVMGDESISSEFKLPKLSRLYLRDLPELKSICREKMICDSLEFIYVLHCEKLKRIPIYLPLLENGQPSRRQKICNLFISPKEWWESVEWEHPNAKDVLRPYVTFEPSTIEVDMQNRRFLDLRRKRDQLCSPSVKHDVTMDDVQSVVKEKTETIASMLEQSNAILDKLSVDDGRIQVEVQGLEQGAEEELICLPPEAESGMENTCAEYIQHVDINDSLEQTRLMESTSGSLVQPGTSASSAKLVGRAFEKNVIWSWLMDDKVSIIGIYGMGGNGKTAMLRNICNELLERQDISLSIYWVNVPQDFRIDKSQDLIAKRLHLNLSSKDDDQCRVVELAMKQKWILILNDLWNSFDPQELGIRIPLNGSKFIMTTRSKIVCQQMNCQNSIRVDPLSHNDALTLFMEKLGHDRQLSQEEKRFAEEAVKECGGLPLGIVTLAESLKGVHELHKWKITLKRLQESNFWDMEDQIFQILRSSYDCLDNSAKQCFVYCALFDESQKIERGVLIESFIEEGIIKEMSRPAAFDKGHSILDSLENVCLLERIDDGKAVKMHDLLRDMAIQILDDEYSLDMRAKEERG